MKITFVLGTANLTGGVRIVAEHARMLHANGHDVTVVCKRPVLPGRLTRVWRKLRGQRIKRTTTASHLDAAAYPVVMVGRPGPIVAADVPDADLVIATWWETAEWVAGFPREKGVKVNFLQHYEVHPWLPADRVKAVWRLPMRKIVVSEWLAGIAREEFGDPTAILVPNGLDLEVFRYVDRGPSGRRIIGGMYAGVGKESFKRFWLAVETVRTLLSRDAACRFVGFGARAAGPGELPEGSEFEIAPPQKRIAEIYASCDCWLFTSDKEGYGLPLLEAMASGTPVVATPAGAAPELLASGGGRLVDSDDPEVLADAVEEILGLDEASWRAMSRAARAEAEKHSWTAVGDRMEAALKKVLAESR
jgi:glycosyltransferase involved in cell wall biosynthesis